MGAQGAASIGGRLDVLLHERLPVVVTVEQARVSKIRIHTEGTRVQPVVPVPCPRNEYLRWARVA